MRDRPRPDGDPRDPYGILPGGPDAFCERWDADTVDEALAAAEEAPSTTPKAQMKRCPNCFSSRVKTKKHKMSDNPKQKPTKYKCDGCRHHFDNPTDPPAKMSADEAATFTDFVWVDDDDLEAHPAPSFHDELPDFSHGNRTEAIRRAILLTKPWSDDDGLTNRKAAQHVPNGRGFVNYHRKKWREGGHDDLFVDEDTDETATGGSQNSENVEDHTVAENATAVATDDEAAGVDTSSSTATATTE